MAVKNCFIRGSVVRYVQMPAEHVDTQLLEDATRRGEFHFPLLIHLFRMLTTLSRSGQPDETVIANATLITHTPVSCTFRRHLDGAHLVHDASTVSSGAVRLWGKKNAAVFTILFRRMKS